MVPLQLWVHYEREFRKKKQLIRHQLQKEAIQQERIPPVDMNDSHIDTKNKINKNNKFTNPLRNFWG